MSTPARVEGRAHARAGILGNPSDGYGGKAIAVSLYNFAATVRLTASDRFRIVPGQGDALEFATLREAGDFYSQVDCEDGLRLLRAAVARFRRHVGALDGIDSADPRLRVSMSYETTIPRQVGLAGSSAIIIAALRALSAWFEQPIPDFDLAELALAAEIDDLRHPAGAMDRVIQAYEGVMVMELREPRRESGYQRLDAAALPPFVIAWDPRGGEDSGRPHGRLRDRWLAGDREVLAVIEALRELVDQGVACLERGDAATFRTLVDRNFELRTQIFDVGSRDREMIGIARGCDAAAKLCGSGGAVLAVPADASGLDALAEAFVDGGYRCERPVLAPPSETP